MINKAFIYFGIKNLMERNYNVSVYEIDLIAEIDETLSFKENWDKIKLKVLKLTPKKYLKNNSKNQSLVDELYGLGIEFF